MYNQPFRNNDNLGAMLSGFILGLVGYNQIEGIRGYQEYYWIRAAAALIIFTLGMKLTARLLRYLASELAFREANKSTELKASSQWARRLDVLRLVEKTGLFLGALQRSNPVRPVIMDWVSNAVVIGPAGVGKGHFTLVNTCINLPFAKLCVDFKSELYAILKPVLEARGEQVVVIDIGNQLDPGITAFLNPLKPLADLFWTTGGLSLITVEGEEIAQVLLIEPEKGGEDAYFRDGSRILIRLAIIISILLDGDDASLGDVGLLISDREKLRTTLELICGSFTRTVEEEAEDGTKVKKTITDPPLPIEQSPWVKLHQPREVETFMTWLRAECESMLGLMKGSETRTFDSFVSGAQQALRPFDVTTHVNKVTSRHTVDLDDLKKPDRPISLFFTFDASRPNAQKPVVGLMFWAAMATIKRHKDNKIPVYNIADECTNWVIPDLQNLMTYGRTYGLRNLLIFQSIAAFKQTYSEECLSTVWSETELKQFLPGQRDPDTLKLIKDMLGEAGVMAKSYGGESPGQSRRLEGMNLTEEARPLLTEDEIRRTPYAINIVRQMRPFLTEPVSYSEIHPYRTALGDNPYYGKPFLKPVKLTLPIPGLKKKKRTR